MVAVDGNFGRALGLHGGGRGASGWRGVGGNVGGDGGDESEID